MAFWGKREVQLIIEEALANTCRYRRLHALQTIVLLTLALVTGLRPGSFMASSAEYGRLGRTLYLKDISIDRIDVGLFKVTLRIRNFKVR